MLISKRSGQTQDLSANVNKKSLMKGMAPDKGATSFVGGDSVAAVNQPGLNNRIFSHLHRRRCYPGIPRGRRAAGYRSIK